MLDLDSLPELWFRSKAGDRAARDELVEGYLWLAKKLAYSQRIPDHMEREELVSWACGGLLEAVTRFDPSTSDGNYHRHFTAYASTRIRGAILDGLKSPTVSWASRMVWRRLQDQNAAEEELAQRLGRKATRAEIAEHLGVKVQDLEHLQQMVPMGSTSTDDDDDARGFEALAGSDTTDQEGEFATMARRLARGLAELPPHLGDIAGRLFYDGATLTQISRDTGAQPSRVRKDRSDALAALRGVLQSF